MNAVRFVIGARTAWRLGLNNVLRVLLYRLRCRIGAIAIEPVAVAPGDFFLATPVVGAPAPRHAVAVKCFGWKPVEPAIAQPLDWFLHPFTLQRYAEPERPWHELPDYDEHFGDIKCVWELSRWDWVLFFAQRYRTAADVSVITIVNAWLRDWLERNPPYRGPNWKCGQEASIRIMHVAMAALLLDQIRNPAPGLIDLVRLHLRRIEPTLAYAMAQDNNHGTSEAAALFIGGSWLVAQGHSDAVRWESLGRHWLEDRVTRLIENDGSFSQYSVNYHRVLLDTLSMVEIWRRRSRLPGFASQWSVRAEAAARWLHAIVDPETGDAPNVGANDGARLLPLTDTDYRDFRPSVQLAMALFARQIAYSKSAAWNLPLEWLGIDLPNALAVRPESRRFDDGGYALIRSGSVMALMRYPRFRFRPSHADALHVDLWKDGINLLRDSGTFSYSANPAWMSYFCGTAGHNTVQFDDRDQMPRFGRFLFGDWLSSESVDEIRHDRDATTFGAAYRDGWGARHERRISLTKTRLKVEDRIEGFSRRAVLRWRVMPGAWGVGGTVITNGEHVLSVSASVTIRRLELVTGWESRYYMQKTQLPVLEVEVHEPGVLISEYRWQK